MKILIVGLKKNPQLTRIVEEGKKRGHKVEGCFTSELVINAEKDSFKPTLRGRPINYDLIYLWAAGRRRWEWYTTAYYLKQKYETIVVNNKVVDPNYKLFLTPAMNYMKQVKEELPFPKSILIFSEKSVDLVIDKYIFPVILKSSATKQGRGVFLLNSTEELKDKIIKLKKDSWSFIIREFIPNNGDIRVFTVGYKAIGAMKRTPARKGEFRSNISVGGKGEKYDLKKTPKVRELAERMSKISQTEIAGVDIMLHKDTGDPYILEINPGPQFTGFEKYTGINAAGEIIKYFESLKKKNEL
jgi:RimK family alpha-L-glutamate ligase